MGMLFVDIPGGVSYVNHFEALRACVGALTICISQPHKFHTVACVQFFVHGCVCVPRHVSRVRCFVLSTHHRCCFQVEVDVLLLRIKPQHIHHAHEEAFAITYVNF